MFSGLEARVPFADRTLVDYVFNIPWEMKAKDGKLYVSAIFDCYDLMPNGLAMADNMRAELCSQTVKNACLCYPAIRGAIIHSDRGSQYTSSEYRDTLQKCGIVQSMNSAGGRCSMLNYPLLLSQNILRKLCQVILTISP